MVELNVVGWAAVLAPGAVLGGAVGLLTHKPIGWCALIGSGTSWAGALLVDSLHWRASEVGIMLPEDFSDDERDRLLRAVAADGVVASIRAEADPDTGSVYWQAVTTMRFRETVERSIIPLSGAAEVSG